MKKFLKALLAALTAAGLILNLGSCDFIKAVCPHRFSEWEATLPATCTSAGVSKRECSICGEVEEEAIEKEPHTESDWIVDKVPTNTEDGSEHTECTVCGITISVRKTALALPRSEAYTLSELVNVDDIAYVEFTVDYYLSSSVPRPYITDNVDSFLNLLQNDENSDLQFIADIEDVYDLCNKLLYESFDFSRNGDCYVIYYLLDCEKHTIAHGTIYCNNYINVFVSETDTLYCSESPANIDLESLIDSINAKKL